MKENKNLGKKEKKTEKKRNETVVGNMICNGIINL